MRVRRVIRMALAPAVLVFLAGAEAEAFTSSLAVNKNKTTVRVSPSNTKLPPYAVALQDALLAETQATHMPFVITQPFRFLIHFVLNRQGQLVHLNLLEGSNSAEANQYAVSIVRRAALNFRPPPADILRSGYAGFVLPLWLGKPDVMSEIAGPPKTPIQLSPSRSPAPAGGR